MTVFVSVKFDLNVTILSVLPEQPVIVMHKRGDCIYTYDRETWQQNSITNFWNLKCKVDVNKY
jgi:hypothetical protein